MDYFGTNLSLNPDAVASAPFNIPTSGAIENTYSPYQSLSPIDYSQPTSGTATQTAGGFSFANLSNGLLNLASGLTPLLVATGAVKPTTTGGVVASPSSTVTTKASNIYWIIAGVVVLVVGIVWIARRK